MTSWLRGDRHPEQIEGAALRPGRRGKNGRDAITSEADDIARERGEIGE